MNSIVDSGHVFARTYAGSTLTPAMHTAERLSGMTQVSFMSRLAAQTDLTGVQEKLKTISSIVLKQPTLRVAVTCGEGAVSANEKALIRFISALPDHAGTSATDLPSGVSQVAPKMSVTQH